MVDDRARSQQGKRNEVCGSLRSPAPSGDSGPPAAVAAAESASGWQRVGLLGSERSFRQTTLLARDGEFAVASSAGQIRQVGRDPGSHVSRRDQAQARLICRRTLGTASRFTGTEFTRVLPALLERGKTPRGGNRQAVATGRPRQGRARGKEETPPQNPAQAGCSCAYRCASIVERARTAAARRADCRTGTPAAVAFAPCSGTWGARPPSRGERCTWSRMSASSGAGRATDWARSFSRYTRRTGSEQPTVTAGELRSARPTLEQGVTPPALERARA